MSRVLQMALVACFATLACHVSAAEYLNGIKWEEPVKVTPGKENRDAPSDATVLFDGTNLDSWHGGDKWSVADGVATIGKGQITSKQKFGDCQLHIEWSAPNPPKGEGQNCGNSGVFLMGRYEIQVLDSYSTDTYHDGQAGGIYKQTPPAVNAMRKPGEWNTYDIYWTCPRFDEDGKLLSPAYITAVHNGVLILNHFEMLGDTPYHRPPAYEAHEPVGPISLQDHGSPVRYRNIWVREYKPAEGKPERDPFLREGNKETPLKVSSMDGDWVLTKIDGDPLPDGVDEPLLTVGANNAVAGYTSLNRMMGQLADPESGSSLFGPLATTRRAGSPAAMQLERQYTKALSEVDAFKTIDDQLQLLAGDEVRLVFTPAAP